LGISVKGLTIPALQIKLDSKISFEENLKEIKEKLSSSFFKGAVVIIDTDGLKLTKNQEKQLEDLLKEHNSQILSYKLEEREKKQSHHISNISREKSLKIINKTIRSGQRIEHDGDILILGDVNPDAYVIASGNIIVMGKLRGIVHAGANGDETAEVIALKLQPQQLRIAWHFTRAPDEEEKEDNNYPEKAYVENNQIYIERI
jgi:septum site-determining protein MinC